jgi:hypothetical protein
LSNCPASPCAILPFAALLLFLLAALLLHP